MNKLLLLLWLLFLTKVFFAQSPDSIGNGLYYYDIPWPANYGKVITSINIDNSGKKWLGTYYGLIYLQDTTWSQFYNTSNLSLPNNNVTCITNFGNGIVVGTKNGFSIFNGIDWTIYNQSNCPIADSTIKCVHVIGNTIWFGTEKGISIFNGLIWQNLNTQNSQLPGNIIFSIKSTSNSIVWIATENGLCRINNLTFYTYPASVVDSNYSIDAASLCVDNEDSVWFSFQFHDDFNTKNSLFFKVRDTVLADLFFIYWGNNRIKNAMPIIEKNPNGGVILSTLDGEFFLLKNTIKEYPVNQNNIKFTIFNDEIWFISGYSQSLKKVKLSECQSLFQINFLDTNNLRVGISANGNIFSDEKIESMSDIPKYSGLTTMLNSNLWIAGKDDNNSLHITAQFNYISGNEWFCGPVMDSIIYQQEAEKWNRTWKLSKKEIDYHKNHWHLITYKTPSSILNWPGNGDTNIGQSYFLAPYFDANSNHTYDPQNGDYPIIKGDQAVFFILNDMNNHDSAFGKKMGVEVHGMLYEFFNITNYTVNNTLFASYRIINHSNNNYDSLYLGLLNSFGIGYIYDDYVGCDSTLNLSYAYNATQYDGFPTIPSFKDNPPVMGSVNLNYPMSGFMKILKSLNKPWNWPSTDFEFYNYLQSKWLDGTHLYYGGLGYPGVNGTSDTICHYMHHGIWTEASVNNYPWCRYGLQSTGPVNLDKDSSICFDVAYIYARDTSIESSINLLKQRSVQIQNYYNLNLAYDCSDFETAIQNQNFDKNNTFEIFPNPAQNVLNIKSKENQDFSIEIMDVSGKILLKEDRKNSSQTLNVRSFSPGIYLLKISTTDSLVIRKFVKN